METMETILERLHAIADEKNAIFTSRLVPGIPPEHFFGCRTPALRSLAKSLDLEDAGVQQFLHTLPHTYFDENQLHAFLIARLRSFDECLAAVEVFLPFVDNWATCDQLSPAVFRREAARLLDVVPRWLDASHVYTVRFGISVLMRYFLDDRFAPRYLEWIASLRSEEYYINMEIAWYFATALAKQPESVLPYFTEKRLPEWVHRKAIQKAIESRRIPDETKQYLRTLR